MAERAHPDDRGFKDKLFGLRKNRYRQLLFDRYHFCNEYIADKTVIDIPCGTGWGTSFLTGARSITGLDIDAESVEFAKRKYKTTKLDFREGSMNDLDFEDNSLDVVICLEGFEHVTREIGASFITEAKRVLKADGLLILSSPIIKTGGKHSGNPYHLYEYPEYELLDIINSNFYSIRIEEIETPDNPIIRFVGRVKSE
jgi:2-polyprenyl-3-methyl-5-hydroxy-6-metoxy-1,4-benzoquinol methylase